MLNLYVLSISLLLTCVAGTTIPGGEYLKIPLLHRNLSGPAETLAADTRRLSTLLRRGHVTKSPLISGAVSGAGQYFVGLWIGTPPQKLLLVADTGSDLVWLRCSACRNCSGRSPGTAFLARHSATFSPYHCYADECRLVPPPDPVPKCKPTRVHSPCWYEYSYADGSVTTGFFSSETTTLRLSSGNETTMTQRVNFGCSFRNSGPNSFNGAQGVLGLGNGPTSFATQLGRRYGNKFSYCLMDYTISPPPTSYLAIGELASKRMKFTPLLTNPLSPTFYYVGIESIYVGSEKLPISPSVWSVDELGNGGTVVDSGTTLTFLVEPAYRLILTAFRKRVELPSPSEPVPGFELCVNVSGKPRASLPRLRFRLGGGSVMSPPARNYLIEVGEGVKCLAIQAVSSESGFSVIGNLMQQGFLMEFDRERSRLGFTRHGCALRS